MKNDNEMISSTLQHMVHRVDTHCKIVHEMHKIVHCT